MITQEAMGEMLNFMSTLQGAGCGTEFVAEQGYLYALALLREEMVKRLPSGTDVESTSTAWMRKAALWVIQASGKLGIRTEQQQEATNESFRR